MVVQEGKNKFGFPFWVLLLLLLPVIMGQDRCGRSARGFFSDDPAPFMEGTWDVTYDNQISVEIDLGGGAVYYGAVSGAGGHVAFVHDGEPVELDLDCSRPWVVCPSDVWTDTVEFLQPRFDERPHQVQMLVREQECLNPRMPMVEEGECSLDPDDNLPCNVEICDPEDVVTTTVSRLASISDPYPLNPAHGDRPEYTIGIWLSGGFVVPAANCLLMGASYADADIVYSGHYEPDPESPTMYATHLEDGLITIVLSGACFWGAYTGTDLGAVLLGARVEINTGFTASIR